VVAPRATLYPLLNGILCCIAIFTIRLFGFCSGRFPILKDKYTMAWASNLAQKLLVAFGLFLVVCPPLVLVV